MDKGQPTAASPNSGSAWGVRAAWPLPGLSAQACDITLIVELDGDRHKLGLFRGPGAMMATGLTCWGTGKGALG